MEPFRGTAHKVFIEDMKTYHDTYDPSEHNGRCISIVQGFASGKNRLMSKLADEVLQGLYYIFDSDNHFAIVPCPPNLSQATAHPRMAER
jgi:hypothetical protein